MKIAVLKESLPFENRVAATPDTVKKSVKMGLTVLVEKDAGLNANFADSAYSNAGATIIENPHELLRDADIILKVQPPKSADKNRHELSSMKSGAILVGLLSPHSHIQELSAYAEQGLTAFALELLPRITRAQVMDALSSQSNLAGYRAVIDAAHEYARAFPMMMTAAGTIRPAKVLVLGAGVAGLQSIATAKRLGAVVTAFDVRSAAREEAKSLGAAVIEVEEDTGQQSQTSGGYAKEMSDQYKQRQSAKIAETLTTSDIVICTALIPGKPAPRLITDSMLQKMKRGAVIVDLAVSAGGNCEGSVEAKIVEKYGVKIIGHANFPARIAADASELYARNVFSFISLFIDSKTGKIKIDTEDEIIRDTMLTHNGQIVHSAFKRKEPALATT
jgi:NAD(P) transhydrogenase subunit alpha